MKRFGFGAMRLPMVNGEVDKEQFNAMIDEFLAAGFTYFDTADRKSTRLNSSHLKLSRMPSSA